MSSPRKVIWETIEGRCEVHREKGLPLSYVSKCLECGLDSGPWPTRLTAAISSLLHLNSHHPKGIIERAPEPELEER